MSTRAVDCQAIRGKVDLKDIIGNQMSGWLSSVETGGGQTKLFGMVVANNHESNMAAEVGRAILGPRSSTMRSEISYIVLGLPERGKHENNDQPGGSNRHDLQALAGSSPSSATYCASQH